MEPFASHRVARRPSMIQFEVELLSPFGMVNPEELRLIVRA